MNLVRISPRAGRGIPGQFSDHSAVSVISRHGAGVNRAPTAEPPTNLKSLCVWFSFVAIQATVFEALLAVAGHAVVHLHAGRPAVQMSRE